MPIHVLTSELISKIAAGEVVERPASVVKELVENSLDAGASQVAIEARGGGIELIRIIDNGSGIPAAEVELAFQRHATSKLSTLSDLENITTLGFRGEALPSIAAVAEVDMVTRSQDEAAGTFVSLSDGEIVEKTKRGCPPGTSVTVRHLFRHVPARLKFLKSAATESNHIAHLVSQYALAFPEVRFVLILEGKGALRTSGSGNLKDVLVEVYGLEIAENMLEIESPPNVLYPKVTGWVSHPRIARSGRSYLSFFVNRRWINSRLLGRAVEEAYQGLLLSGKHPIAVVNVALPPHEVDANVHPTKTEVRFRQEHAVFGIVQKSVRQTLMRQMPAAPAGPTQFPSQPPAARQEFLWQPRQAEKDEEPVAVPSATYSPLPILRVLGQLANTYIIAEGPDGMYLVDQHAAHERVLFEQVKAQREKRQVQVQGLLEPLTVEVTAQQERLLSDHAEVISGYGFGLEPFGERTYLVRTVPAVLKGPEIAGALKEILDLLASEEGLDLRQDEIAASIACHGAVRAGQVLGMEEMRALLRQLEQASLPRTCPHGRPTTIRLSAAQLEKEFRRR